MIYEPHSDANYGHLKDLKMRLNIAGLMGMDIRCSDNVICVDFPRLTKVGSELTRCDCLLKFKRKVSYAQLIAA